MELDVGELHAGGGGEQLLLRAGLLLGRLAGRAAGEMGEEALQFGLVEEVVQVFQHQFLTAVAAVHGSLHSGTASRVVRQAYSSWPPPLLPFLEEG